MTDMSFLCQWRIQDFPEMAQTGGVGNLFDIIFAENSMEMKKKLTGGG